MAPQMIFGTATLGMDGSTFQDAASVASVLQLLKKSGVNRIDSGARYPPRNPGRAEQLLGECKEQSSEFLVDTKVYMDTATDGSGDLTVEAVEKSLSGSLSRLQRRSEGVNVLYIHRADPSTPVREQVRTFNKQIRAGGCKAWGVSNVPLPMFEEMIRICEEEGLQKPVCYQAQYNLISRGAEAELVPLLRKHGVTFNAYGPLAAGFMTGNLVRGNHAGTRFGDENPIGKAIQKHFLDPGLHHAMTKFHDAVAEHGIETTEAAMRWVAYHSMLQDQDGIVFGASKVSQVEGVMKMLQNGPLPADVLKAAEELWTAARESRGTMF